MSRHSKRETHLTENGASFASRFARPSAPTLPLRATCERLGRHRAGSRSGRDPGVASARFLSRISAGSVENQLSPTRREGCPLERHPAHFDRSLESTVSRLARCCLCLPALLQLALVGADQLLGRAE